MKPKQTNNETKPLSMKTELFEIELFLTLKLYLHKTELFDILLFNCV